jgi:cysteine synthase A
MTISVKAEYALQAILDLAMQPPAAPVKIADIARRQKIPQKFLELILVGLKQAGFVESRRGAEGGYLLARQPEQLTVGEVLRFVEGPQQGKGRTRRRVETPFSDMWKRVDSAVAEILEKTTFAELVRTWNEKQRQYVDNSLSIGNTPLVRLNRVTGGAKAAVLAKIEGRNPAYSVKCRIGAAMVWDAEKRGILKPGKELIEPTSGNTGIALAFVAAARGYRVTLTMPATMSVERRKALKVLGANLVLTEGTLGMAGAIAKAEEIQASDPDRYVMLQQFKNPANPEIHFRTTGPEIWDDTGGAVDVLVSGIGTGGTISGVARYIKQVKGKPILAVGIEPLNSPVITQKLAGQPLRPGPHKIQGLGAGFIPDTLDLAQVDRVELIGNEESIDMARRLGKEEGILAGISCGAAAAVAVRLARTPEFEGKTIVTILPDAAERYLSTVLFEGMFDE